MKKDAVFAQDVDAAEEQCFTGIQLPIISSS